MVRFKKTTKPAAKKAAKKNASAKPKQAEAAKPKNATLKAKGAKRAALKAKVAKAKSVAPEAKNVTKPKAAPKSAGAKTAGFDFGTFQSAAREALQVKLDRGKTEFGMGSYQRFNVDQKRELIEFFDDGEIKLSARAQVVGSYSSITGTWLWSWANQSLLPGVKRDLERVRQFGKANRLEAITSDSWDAEEADGWTMTAISARILDSECAYRVPTSNGLVFVLLSGLTKH